VDIQQPSSFPAAAQPVPAPPEAPGPAPDVEAGPDRDLGTLEELEAQLAILEAELARVDASRGDAADSTAHPAAEW
jgi:uncharacterized small protein (DUF1192 family)